MSDMTGDDQPTEPAERQTGGTRGGDGKFTRTPETAQHDAAAAELRARGWSYRRIATELGVTPGNAYAAVQRALKAIVEEPAEEVKKLELERLDAMWTAAWGVLEREHVVVNAGKIVYETIEYARDDEGNIQLDDEGRPVAVRVEPLKDDGPVLAAVDRLVKIQERRARLLGLDAEKKIDLGGKLTYEILGVDLDALR